MPRFKDQAICIRLIDWSETSQVVALLTRDHGKVRGLAKGAKRMSPSSIQRFSGGMEMLTAGQVVATTRPTAELATITEWDLQVPNHHFRTDLNAQMLGLYAADIAGCMLETLDPHPQCFDALHAFLIEIATPDARQRALLDYQWTILNDCGYRPQLDADVHTGEALGTGPHSFDGIAGGLTDRPVSNGAHAGSVAGPGPWRVSKPTVALLRALAAGETDALGEASEDALRRANRLLCVYLRTILDRELPTMRAVLGNGK